ncbi:MAG: SDR family NAD(P)-dependent oxidoreductase [Microbacterium sp.]|uniref:SDR family NAD(P)-dependent oxidoreductase n=1 Tax=Microbacterium sp. TaxID=51671 RepID=UPI0039E5D9B6
MARDEWDPRSLPDLTGRVFMVTGSNAGLGFFSSEQLARAGAHVVMTGRNPNRLAAARATIERRLTDAGEPADLETLLMDTSNLGSIRAAAATARGRRKLDGLLLNAGIVHAPHTRETTPDGYELVFATNVLGHFALAAELLPNLAAAGGRMVWIGSMSSWLWPHTLDDIQLEEGYSAWRAYVQSKVAAAALGFEADRRLRDVGVPVSSVVAHPGYSISGRTPAIRDINEPSRWGRFADNLQTPISQSKEHGAWTLVRALVDPAIDSGEFLGPRYIAHGEPRRQSPAKVVRDPEIGARVWEACETMTRMPWPFARAARAARRAR